MEKSMDKIVALAKSRGFVYPGSEIYGGLANTWDYGNLGDTGGDEELHRGEPGSVSELRQAQFYGHPPVQPDV